MFRATILLTFAFAISTAIAAPVPRPSEKEILAKYWGKTEGQGEFELKGKQLTIRTGGQPARGIIHHDRMDMPRATRFIAGDFEVTVKVVDAALPKKDSKHEDAARRFIALVDELYDRNVNLIVSAAAPPGELYHGNKLAFEFQRTQSRLIEMQSEEYLSRPHRA